MSTRIRLRRMGASKRPFYRVVVADQRSPRNGRFIEAIGKYHPLEEPSLIQIDEERALHWLRTGAQPSDQVRNLMTKVGIWERFTAERPSAAVASPKYERVAKEKLSKKAASKAEAAQDAQAATTSHARAAEAPAGTPEPQTPTAQSESPGAQDEAAAEPSPDEPAEA